MHCQICLTPVPDHAPNCPVLTGEPVTGSIHDQQAEYAIGKALQLGQQQLLQSGMMGQGRFHQTHGHDPTAIELRLESVEKEIHLLRARIAKLERSDAY